MIFEIRLRDNSTFNSSSTVDITLNDTQSEDLLITIENNAAWNVTSHFTINQTDTDIVEIVLNDNGIFNIDGNFVYDNTSSSNYFLLDMNNNAIMTVDGFFSATQDAAQNLSVILDSDASLTVLGDFDLIKAGNGDVIFHLNQNTNGTTDAQVNIGGEFYIDRNVGDEVEIYLAQHSDLIIGGGMRLEVFDSNNDADFTTIDLDDDASLQITGNLNIFMDEFPTGNNSELNFLLDNNSSLTVSGNSDIVFEGGDINFTLNNNSVFDLSGNMEIDESNAAGFFLVQNNASQFLIDGYFNLTKSTSDAGNVDFDLDNTSQLTIGEYVSVFTNGSGNVAFELDGDASVTIPDSLGITNNDNGNIEIHLNQNANGSAADAQLSIGNYLRLYRLGTNGDEIQIYLADGSDLSIANDFKIRVEDTDNDADFIRFDLDDNSSISLNGSLDVGMEEAPVGNQVEFEILMANNSVFTINDGIVLVNEGGDNTFSLSNNAYLNITGDWVNNITDARSFTIATSDASTIDVSGAFLLTKLSADVGDFYVDMDNTSTFTVGDEMQIISEGLDDVIFELDRDASLNITDSLGISKINSGDVQIHLNQNANGTGADAQFTIGNYLRIYRIGTNGDRVQVYLSEDANLNVNGDITIETFDTENNDDFVRFDLNNDANLTITGNLNVNMDEVPTGNDAEFEILMTENAVFNIPLDFNLTTEGGDNIIDLQDNAVLTITGNWTNVCTDASAFDVDISDNAVLNNVGNFSYTKTNNSGGGFAFDLQDNGNLDIDGNVTIDEHSSDAVTFELDHDAVIDVVGNVTVSKENGTNAQVRMNLNNNGTTDTRFNVGGNFFIEQLLGNDIDLFIDESGQLNIAGDLTIEFNNHDNPGNDITNIRLRNDAQINVDGSTTIDINYLAGTTDQLVTLNDNSQFNTGPSGGPFNTESINFIVTQSSADWMINVNDNAILRSYGDLNILKSSGANVRLRGNNGTGTNALIYVEGDLDLDNIENADLIHVDLNQASLLDVNGDIDLRDANGAARIELDLTSTAKIEIEGNFLRSGGFGILDCASGTTVEYNGTSSTQLFAQDAGSGGDSFDYMNVIINNTFGTSPQISMEGLATVHESITFTDGVVSSDVVNLLVVDDEATALTASDASHVDGLIRKIGNNVFDFPVGDNGHYRPISISAPANNSDAFQAQYFDVDPGPTYDDTSLDPTIDHISDCEYWILDLANGTPTIDVTLSYRDYDPAKNCSGVSVPADLLVSRWDGAVWRDHGGTPAGLPNNGTITAIGFNSFIPFNPFTIATYTSANDLPVEWLSFDVIKNENDVDVLWSTASETNSDYFMVERSIDNLNFVSIGQVDAAGNSNSIINYRFEDANPHNGWSYYRLKQFDLNGAYSYSSTKSVYFSTENNFSFNIYPNPTQDGIVNVLASAEGNYEITVVNSIGQIIYSKNMVLDKNPSILNLSDISNGVYFITIKNTDSQDVFTGKIIR